MPRKKKGYDFSKHAVGNLEFIEGVFHAEFEEEEMRGVG